MLRSGESKNDYRVFAGRRAVGRRRQEDSSTITAHAEYDYRYAEHRYAEHRCAEYEHEYDYRCAEYDYRSR